jgi:UDP-N-acetylglucosamine--N-acetylmuramyl-(pentapeptide) pyrophosphoryl-undecaprenol N-acetylglucosamine transferase
MKILAVGGGSGGHVTPVAAVLKELAKQEKTPPEVTFVCDKGFLKQSQGIMGALPFPVVIKTIPSGKLRRYAHFSWWHYIRHFSIVLHNIADTAKTAAGFFASLWIIMRVRPDVVFAKGGFVCLPVGLAAHVCGVPLVIHDSDARPGLTNKLLARFAQAIGTGMPTENYNYNSAITTHVGVPIGADFVPVTEALRTQYRHDLDLPTKKRIVVSVGGGLGAVSINTAMIQAAQTSDDSTLFYNVTGIKNFEAVAEQTKELGNYIATPFVYTDMFKLLGAADIVVTRASATTLQELAGLGQAVIAVPARQLGDQHKNAQLFARYDAVVALEDAISALLSDTKRRKQLAKSLHSFARPHAARDMARMIVQAKKGRV